MCERGVGEREGKGGWGGAHGLMLVWPPKSQTWNFRFLYVTVSTLNPIAAEAVRARRRGSAEKPGRQGGSNMRAGAQQW